MAAPSSRRVNRLICPVNARGLALKGGGGVGALPKSVLIACLGNPPGLPLSPTFKARFQSHSRLLTVSCRLLLLVQLGVGGKQDWPTM